eukprot:7430637-Karenia_brevis.AAC.1
MGRSCGRRSPAHAKEQIEHGTQSFRQVVAVAACRPPAGGQAVAIYWASVQAALQTVVWSASYQPLRTASIFT